MTMGDNLHRTFALLIAQVLPGLILVFGAAPHIPALKQWLGAAAEQDLTIGGTVMVTMLAITCGVTLSGARFLIFERLCGIDQGCELKINEAARAWPEVRAAEDVLVMHHYAYYQFYGSAALAWPLVVILNLSVSIPGPAKAAILFGCVVIEYVLWASACDAMKRFLRKQAAVVQMPIEGTHEQRSSRQNQVRDSNAAGAP